MTGFDENTRKILESIKNLPSLPAASGDHKDDKKREENFRKKVAHLENYTKEGPIVIGIDAGHGWGANGQLLKGTHAINDDGTRVEESTLTREYALQAKKMFEDKGYKVVFTSSTKEAPLKGDLFGSRITPSKENNAAVFISIHMNNNKNEDLKGPEIYIANKTPGLKDEHGKPTKNHLPRELADTIAEGMGHGARVFDYASKAVTVYKHTSKYKGEVHSPLTTAALVEMGYFSNKEDFAKLQTPEYRDELLTKMVNAVDKHIVSQKEKYNQLMVEYLGIDPKINITAETIPTKDTSSLTPSLKPFSIPLEIINKSTQITIK